MFISRVSGLIPLIFLPLFIFMHEGVTQVNGAAAGHQDLRGTEAINFYNGPLRVLYDTRGKELPTDEENRWIDIDLSSQMLTAYSGGEISRTFVVSTGTRFTPTVIGQFRIYEQFAEGPMSGPGYYVPKVKYIQYFYKGYGIHAADWHDKFGTPTSHGCVQLTEGEAAWLYRWAFVGTLVNVHY